MMTYIVTTSHRPSQRTRSFVKELVRVLPRALRINRGKRTLEDLLYDAVELRAKRIIVAGERRGNPGLLRFYEPRPPGGLALLSEMLLRGVTLAREAGARLPSEPRSIGLELGGELGEEEADLIAEAFAAKILLPGEEADIHIVARRKNDLLVLRFTDRRGRLRGPVIRVRVMRRWGE